LTLAVEVAERRRADHLAVVAASARAWAEIEAMQAASSERQRIVRETHDIVGHALTAMLLQAGAARRLGDDDPVKARQLLASIETTGRDAFRDLDVALGLADNPSDAQQSPGLAGVPDLVDNMRRAGLDLDLEITGEHQHVPRLIDWSAYRIVQEATTNIAKHAPQSHAVVSISYTPGDIVIDVTNDAAHGNGDGTAGTGSRNGSNGNGNGHGNGASGAHRGLVGLRERVAVLGGEIEAGRTDSDQFVIRARLPLPRHRV
jgi:signal transduction histidine kinase